MATSSVNQTPAGAVYRNVFDVIATADADTTITINHAVPFVNAADAAAGLYVLEPLLPNFFTSQWTITGKTATTVTLTKNSVAVGTGNAAAQVRLHVVKEHSAVE